MLKRLENISRLPTKILNQLKLLRQDPERFGRNLTQFTNPKLFEQRLVDVMGTGPMHVRYKSDPVGPLRLNVLDASWSVRGMTGGPNTVINLICRVAQQGLSVRLVSTLESASIDPMWFRNHAESLLGSATFPDVAIASAAQPKQPLELGPRDVFLATHWLTAQQLKSVLPRLPIRQFFYMLQEFEPGFYAWSSNFALAIETYGLDFWPIINEAPLAEYLLSQPLGRLSDPIMRERALIFEPAVDGAVFHCDSKPAVSRPRRLLFYARATNTRNLFGVGLLALRRASADPAFAGWEFQSIGSRDGIPDLQLCQDQILRRAPWVSYSGYGDVLRSGDILLCPMLSPHTSYPVLEMAACGGLSVTNTFATKTRTLLEGLSDNIIAVEPTIEALSDGLVRAARQVNAGRPRLASLNMPRDWGTALDPVAKKVAATLRHLTAGG